MIEDADKDGAIAFEFNNGIYVKRSVFLDMEKSGILDKLPFSGSKHADLDVFDVLGKKLIYRKNEGYTTDWYFFGFYKNPNKAQNIKNALAAYTNMKKNARKVIKVTQYK